VEPVDHEVVRRRPRDTSRRIISRGLLLNVLLAAAIIIAGTLWVFNREVSLTPLASTITNICLRKHVCVLALGVFNITSMYLQTLTLSHMLIRMTLPKILYFIS
jgi:hypothetical protein